MMTPPRLAPQLPSLPPMLYIIYQNPISGCSKAPRGLSVLPQVTRIFTGTTISPSPLLRQCPNRYAFRAGRNLPDKEFRYLRTVIVTAAVYWGFSSKLLRHSTHLTKMFLLIKTVECRITFPLNLPAPGRRQRLYFGFLLSRYLCFC